MLKIVGSDMKKIPKFEIYKNRKNGIYPELKIWHSKGKWEWEVKQIKQAWEIYEICQGREAEYVDLSEIKVYPHRIDAIREYGERYASVDLSIPAIVFPILHTENYRYKIYDGKHRYKKSVELGLPSLLSYIVEPSDSMTKYSGKEDTIEAANLAAVRILTILVEKQNIA